MVEIFLILLGGGYLIYKVTVEIPRYFKRTEDKIDMLKFHLQEIELRINQLDKKLDEKNNR